MSQAKTVKEVLIATEWILNNLYWCQGQYWRDADGCQVANPTSWDLHSVCAVGALRLVETTDPLRMEAGMLLNKEVGGHIAEFNDAKDRKKSEVLAVIRKAIEKADNK